MLFCIQSLLNESIIQAPVIAYFPVTEEMCFVVKSNTFRFYLYEFNGHKLHGRGSIYTKSVKMTMSHHYIGSRFKTNRTFEPRLEKTGFLHMRKQRRRSASR